jgi:hypothetical protein
VHDPEGLVANLEAYQAAVDEARALGCTQEQLNWPEDRDYDRDINHLSVEPDIERAPEIERDDRDNLGYDR